MIKKDIGIIVVILIQFTCVFSAVANTKIEGLATEFAGQTIELLRYDNPIDFNEEKIATCKVGSDGTFSLSFEVGETNLVFAHVGVYFLFLYAEPDTRYVVQLPPLQDKVPAERLNPYFEEKQAHLIILECWKNGTKLSLQQELNFFIRSFDDYYGPYMAKYAYNVATRKEFAERDSTIKHIENIFPDIPFPFYNNYKNYKIGFLRLLSFKNKSRSISNQYFLNKPVLYAQPAYNELFNQVYDKYFSYFGRTPKGKMIYEDINQSRSFDRLKKTLSEDNILQNDTLKELVILKGIHDEFYRSDFSRAALLTILDSLASNTLIYKHKTIAGQIRAKITKLLAGYPPPNFKLVDQKGEIRSLEDFRGKYVYLNFCTTQNYACISEFDQLKKLYEKHSDKLEIVTILGDDSFKEAQRFIKGKQLSWTFLHYSNQPGILKDYDIRAFPTYFLIDREGKLAISPAPSPAENFEMILFKELKAKGML
jgi:peroxiredoxin